MIRAHTASASTADMRLLYSVRSPADRFFAEELAATHDVEVTLVYTREVPEGWTVAPGRVTRDVLAAQTVPAREAPAVFVCGPTGFVEAVASALVELGHDPISVKTERFGGS